MTSIEALRDESLTDDLSTNQFTRSEFIRAAAGAAATAFLAPYALPAADAAAQLDSRLHMDKTLNTVGYDEETREFVRAGNVDSLVLWSPPWPKLEPKAGQINKKAWHRFDEQLEKAQEDGCPTYVSVWSNVPDWAASTRRHAPTDLTADGPYAGFMDALGSRIATMHPEVLGVISGDEPNLEYNADQDVAAKTVQMMMIADKALCEAGYRGMLLGPATSDGPGCEEFTQEVFGLSAPWQPIHRFGWAHHSYFDVKEGTHRRAEAVLSILQGRWPVYFTEGGYKFDTHHAGMPEEFNYTRPLRPQEEAQKSNVAEHFRWSKATGQVAMWANYIYQDRAWGGGGFMSGLVRIDGTPHPLREEWSRL